MAEFNVQINELVAKANTLNELNQTFKGQVERLVETEGSLGGMWEGEARNSFHTAFNNDVQQMGVFHTAVATYVETLLGAAEKYQMAEALNIELGKTRKY